MYVANEEAVPRAWAPDGKTLAVSSGPHLLLLDTEQGTVVLVRMGVSVVAVAVDDVEEVVIVV